jgi:hypothetical protein
MNSIFDLTQVDLENLTTGEYFERIESVVDKKMDIERMTELFSLGHYSETKPYLIRRQLIPADKRFSQIELVYEAPHRIEAIVWHIRVSLSQLTDYFGEPIIHYEPYSNSTVFAFRSKNHNIEIIETRHPGWLTKLTDNTFEYESKDKSIQTLIDPEFSFIQFDIAD